MNARSLRWEWYVFVVCCVFGLLARFLPAAEQDVSGEGEAVFVPIVMYHSLLKDPARANDYTVSPTTLEADLKYLAAEGYETVVIQDLIDYVYLGEPLPDKPVILTFDDGHLNTMTYGLPLLQKYHAKAVVSVVGAYVEEAVRQNDPNPQYAYLTWEDLKALRDSGCFEIQNHSYNLHNNKNVMGVKRKSGEVLATYQERLSSDVLKMQKALYEHSGINATAFTYPYGLFEKEGEQVLRELGFLATMTCEEKPNYITRSPESLFMLKRYNRPAGLSTARFMKKALKR